MSLDSGYTLSEYFGKRCALAPFWFLLEIKGITLLRAGRRDVAHMNITVPKTMIHFVANDLHETDYKRLDDWDFQD